MKKIEVKERPTQNNKGVSRRNFLGYAGVSAVLLGTLMVGCDDDTEPDPPSDTGVDLGSGDTGILNYAYALEQLEAAFYTAVVTNPYAGITSEEGRIMEDLQKHEIIHRDFFKAALGSNAIPDLSVDFSSIDFTDRASVLATAKAFEDLGVSAYNGAGKLLADVNNLLLAGKIVSVEARHAAAIRDLINPNSADFAGDDIVDPVTGLGLARTPSDVLTIASTYVTTKINASNLPK